MNIIIELQKGKENTVEQISLIHVCFMLVKANFLLGFHHEIAWEQSRGEIVYLIMLQLFLNARFCHWLLWCIGCAMNIQ